jgi:hypothetical protein
MNTSHTPDGVPSDMPFTTDILAEPIAQGGLGACYQFIGDEPWNDTGKLIIEVLSKPEKTAYLANAAADLGLHFAIVHDANGRKWRILEAQGSQEAIKAFAAKAEKVNIRRAA